MRGKGGGHKLFCHLSGCVWGERGEEEGSKKISGKTGGSYKFL